MPGYDCIIPHIIAIAKDLTASEKIFYALLRSLTKKYGFCFASNDYLVENTGMSLRSIRYHLKKLSQLGLIIVEIDYGYERKIWFPETIIHKKRLIEEYGEEFINSRDDSKNDSGGGAKVARGGCKSCTHIYIPYKDNNIKHREELPPKEPWPKPARSSDQITSSSEQEPRVKQLPRQMTDPKLPPPTPGPAEMVDETEELLSHPITVGSQRLLVHPDDIKFFLGFSPQTILMAIDVACRDSRNGTRIHGIVPYLFKQCSKLRKRK